MTLGRTPITFKSSEVPLPAPIDDENMHASSPVCVQPEGTFSRTSFYVENLRLSNILGEILSEVYRPRNELETLQDTARSRSWHPSNFDSLLALDSTLSEFEGNVPPILQWAR